MIFLAHASSCEYNKRQNTNKIKQFAMIVDNEKLETERVDLSAIVSELFHVQRS
jgi:hypothetical protein